MFDYYCVLREYMFYLTGCMKLEKEGREYRCYGLEVTFTKRDDGRRRVGLEASEFMLVLYFVLEPELLRTEFFSCERWYLAVKAPVVMYYQRKYLSILRKKRGAEPSHDIWDMGEEKPASTGPGLLTSAGFFDGKMQSRFLFYLLG